MPFWGVVSEKGGVGNTTTAVNRDPQGNATTGLGVSKGTLKNTQHGVLVKATRHRFPTSHGADANGEFVKEVMQECVAH